MSSRNYLLVFLFFIYQFCFCQHTALDPTFGTGGKMIHDIGMTSIGVSKMIIQPDGKIIAASIVYERLTLSRYNIDGTLDSSFGNNGVATNNAIWVVGNGVHATMFLQTDGKILVITDKSLARFNANGTIDNTFGNNGSKRFIQNFGNGHYDVVIQPDNKFIVSFYDTSDFKAARFNPDGTFDISFGNNGIVTINFGLHSDPYYPNSYDIVRKIKLQPDGKIILAGISDVDSGLNPEIRRTYGLALVRLDQTGNLDPSFGIGGKVVLNYGISSALTDIILTENNNIIVNGQINTSYGVESNVLAKYDSNGNLDTNFGTNGIVISPFQNLRINAIILDNNSKIILGGSVFPNYALVRFNSNGALDTSFGNNGIFLDTFGQSANPTMHFINSMVLQSDHKIVVCGAKYSPYGILGFARYDTNAVLSSKTFANFSDTTLFPMPFIQDLNLDFTLKEGDYLSADLFDINGRKLGSIFSNKYFNSGKNTQSLNLPSDLSNGNYFMRIYSNNWSQTFKIIK